MLDTPCSRKRASRLSSRVSTSLTVRLIRSGSVRGVTARDVRDVGQAAQGAAAEVEAVEDDVAGE